MGNYIDDKYHEIDIQRGLELLKSGDICQLYSDGLEDDEYIWYDNETESFKYEDNCTISQSIDGVIKIIEAWSENHKFYYQSYKSIVINYIEKFAQNKEKIIHAENTNVENPLFCMYLLFTKEQIINATKKDIFDFIKILNTIVIKYKDFDIKYDVISLPVRLQYRISDCAIYLHISNKVKNMYNPFLAAAFILYKCNNNEKYRKVIIDEGIKIINNNININEYIKI